MAKLYSNENFSLPVVQELRRLGHDVLTIQDTGKAGQAGRIHAAVDAASDLRGKLIRVNRPAR